MKVPLVINDFLRRAVSLYPGKVAIIDGDKWLIYEQLFQERANRLSRALLAAGVCKGDRVCILSPNAHLWRITSTLSTTPE